MNEVLTAPNTSTQEIQKKFELLKENQFRIGNTDYKERKRKLKLLHQAILKYREDIKEAMHKDYRKHPSEVDLTEVYTITSEIKHAHRHLKK